MTHSKDIAATFSGSDQRFLADEAFSKQFNSAVFSKEAIEVFPALKKYAGKRLLVKFYAMYETMPGKLPVMALYMVYEPRSAGEPRFLSHYFAKALDQFSAEEAKAPSYTDLIRKVLLKKERRLKVGWVDYSSGSWDHRLASASVGRILLRLQGIRQSKGEMMRNL